jgi:gluconate 5-dehydrogenase
VLLVARRDAELQAVVKRLQAEGISAHCLAADLVAAGGLLGVAHKAESRLGGVDNLVNAAGVSLRQSFCEVTPDAWRTQIALHLGAPFFLT